MSVSASLRLRKLKKLGREENALPNLTNSTLCIHQRVHSCDLKHKSLILT